MKSGRKNFLSTILAVLITVCGTASTTKYDVVHYDEYNGLAQRWATQIVQGNDGYIWISTWNGLDRFDGYGFVNFKPTYDTGASLPSDRFYYMWKMVNGNLLCMIEDRLVIFDTHTYQFCNPLSELEQRLNKTFSVITVSLQSNGTVLVGCSDGELIAFSTTNPQATAALRKRGSYRGESPFGAKHFVTLSGHDMREAEYCMTDRGGNMWFRSNYGIYKATPYVDQYSMFNLPQQTQVRGLFRDSKGRVWIAGRERKFVMLTDDQGRTLGYLRPDGNLQQNYVEFGHPVYSFCEWRDGTIWLGTKPDGLFRLRPQAGGYTVSNYKYQHVNGSENSNSVYSIAIDRYGRMWLATFSAGLLCFDPKTGRFIRPPHYPSRTVPRTRDIVITPEGYLLLATMRGLVVADINKKNLSDIKFTTHKHDPNRPTSLSNEATMSIFRSLDGTVYVCTESGGINKIKSKNLLSPTLDFERIDTRHGFPSDIVLCMFNNGKDLWAVCNHMLVRIVRPGQYETFSADFFHQRFRYSDARPVALSGGRWLFGLIDGAAIFDLSHIRKSSFKAPVVITGYSIDNGKMAWMPQDRDTITLSSSQRNITVSFAALDYAAPDRIEYAYKMGYGAWNYTHNSHTASFVDLKPGTYKLQIKATNHDGVWSDKVCNLTIIVTPKIWETTLAKVLYIILLVLFLLGVTLLIRYIRNISIRNRNLEAYLRLADTSMAKENETPEAKQEEDMHVLETARVMASDDAFMRRVLAFVEDNVANPEAGVNDMADAAATSRANLNRKMKAILGVSPKEFLQEVRMQKACRMLDDKHAQVNDVAYACGFADPRYFSRVFKAKTGLTPTEYRNRRED